MKTFFRDYVELIKASLRFIGKHWLGLTVFTVIYIIIDAVAIYIYVYGWKETLNFIIRKFNKKEEIEDDLDEVLKDILGE